MTGKVLSRVQTAVLEFLRRARGLFLCKKENSCEIGKTTNVELLLLLRRDHKYGG